MKFVIITNTGTTIIVSAENTLEAINKAFNNYTNLLENNNFSIYTVIDELE